MSNYSVLQKNTLDGLGEMAGILYLKLTDVLRNERKAFLAATEWEENSGGWAIQKVLSEYYRDIPDEVRTSLSHFFSERYRNNYLPDYWKKQ